MIPVFWRYLRMPSRISLSTLLVLFAAVLIFATPPGVQGQAGLSGAVTDPSVDAVANKGTSQAREEKNSPDGVYKLSLPSSNYRVKFIAAGYRTAGIDPVAKNFTEMLDFDQAQPHEPAPAATPASGALTWHGITLYGAYDIGVGWVSHGLPENGYNYEGASLVNRNGYESRFLVAPNNLQQTGLGVRGKEEFRPGWWLSSTRTLASIPSRPARQRIGHPDHQQRPSQEKLFVRHRRRARGPTLQRRNLWWCIVRAIRHADLRSSALSGYGCHAALRSGRRQLCLFVHRI